MLKVTLTKCGEIGIGNKEYISISDIEYEDTNGTPIEFEDTTNDTWKYVGEENSIDDILDSEETNTEPIYNFINFINKFRDNRLHKRLCIYIVTNTTKGDILKIIPDFNPEIQKHDVWANYIDFDIEKTDKRFCVKNHSLDDYYKFSSYDPVIFKEIIKEMILTKELFKNIFKRFGVEKDTIDITVQDLYDEVDRMIEENSLLGSDKVLNTGSDDDAINAKTAVCNFIDEYFKKNRQIRGKLNKEQLAELIVFIKREIGEEILDYVQQAAREASYEEKLPKKIEPLEIEEKTPEIKKNRTWKEFATPNKNRSWGQWVYGEGGRSVKLNTKRKKNYTKKMK